MYSEIADLPSGMLTHRFIMVICFVRLMFSIHSNMTEEYVDSVLIL